MEMKMLGKRILVVGCPGSGKSTFARKLAAFTGLKLVHLDMLFWNEDKTCVAQDVFRNRLQAEMSGDSWIVDGNYASILELRLQSCDMVFFLDYPVEMCLEGIRARRGKARPDMPWVETEEDEEFISFVRGFSRDTRPYMLDLFERYPEKEYKVFHTREEAAAFLRGMKHT